MKFRRPKPSFAVTWILITALAVSPLMAQEPLPPPDTKPVVTEHDNASAETPLVEGEATPSGTPVLVEPLPPRPEPKFPTVARHSTLKAVPLGSTRRAIADDDAPGQSKWIIMVALIGAAAVTGIILLLRGWGGDNGGNNGTVIGAGQPSVNSGLR